MMGIRLTPKKPARLFNRKPIIAAIEREIRKISDDIASDFDRTTATWKTDVAFEQTLSSQRGAIIATVQTFNEIYTFVNNGTKPHIIRPKKPGGTLAFGSGFSPKTIPGVIGSISGGSSGATRFSKGVQHPGTDARNFDKAIARKWEKLLAGRMRPAINRGIKQTGYGI